MEVLQYFHMNGGTSETGYASNSSLQKRGIEVTKPIIQEAILEIINSISSGKDIPKSISIAEMGCSSGPTALLVVSYIIDTIYNNYGALSGSPHPEILVFLNDLSSNDFNLIFKSLQGFYDQLKKTYNSLGDADDDQKQHRCFVAGIPGSFYGRLFPSRSLHFVHSSYSLHWLSQSPQGIKKSNKGNGYMAESSPPSVLEAYLKQFERDFYSFLKCRFEEIVKGGRLVLTVCGRADDTSPSREMRCFGWGLLAEALREMVSQGKIEEGKLDSFNMPLYIPSPSEVKSVILNEGSFIINRLETFEVTSGEAFLLKDEDDDDDYKITAGKNFANFTRALSESLVVSHFGEEIIEELYKRCREIVAPRLSRDRSMKNKHISIVISLTRE
ncbi:salicylate carboxymethyltransferase-like [Papaver somniferum]|nr:salicylate carboxymethyltransferase-like [Papaver somniferum]